MDHFTYNQGRLCGEGVDLTDLAARVGTPTYVYSAATLTHHVRVLQNAFAELAPTICFAVKCCNNPAVLAHLASLGVGMDVVSGGELERAHRAGVPMEKVVFAGVGKQDGEIRSALSGVHALVPGADAARGSIAAFNVESASEFARLSTLAGELGVEARACLRVNPDVDARTHKYTTTGRHDNKFGVDIDEAPAFFARHGRDANVRLLGLHVHLGSPIYSTEPYVSALTAVGELIDGLEARGHRIEWLNIGGGFGADYVTGRTPSAASYAAAIVPVLAPRVARGLRVFIEPGRFIAANAGVLLTRVRFIKRARAKTFVICDAGMNALIRPALYEAFHFVWPTIVESSFVPGRRVERPEMPGLEPVDVVGPICESGDFIAQDRALPPVREGDVLAVFTAGAYGMTMASTYNDHGRPAEVLVEGSTSRVVRPRETVADLLGPP